jgi:hypothetical protein
MFLTRANAASGFSKCSAPSQLLLKPLLLGEILLRLWPQEVGRNCLEKGLKQQVHFAPSQASVFSV